jgi:hypothetical protein
MISKSLSEKWLLTLKGLYGTAGGKVICAVKKRCDNLGKQFSNCGKLAACLAIAIVFWLSKYKLPAIRGIAQVQPIDAFLEKR